MKQETESGQGVWTSGHDLPTIENQTLCTENNFQALCLGQSEKTIFNSSGVKSSKFFIGWHRLDSKLKRDTSEPCHHASLSVCLF